MDRRFLILFSAFWLCVLAYAFDLVRRNSASSRKPEVATTVLEPVQEAASLKELADHERQTRTQSEGLARMEAKRALRAEAAGQMYEARRRYQVERSTVWSYVISTNAQTFEGLRHTAARAPARATPCTICDGSGAMVFCLLCGDQGKCPSCMGTGKGFHGEICPMCAGLGKCYLCFGSGRMTCLYCDDGTIGGQQPLPPLSMPLRCDAPAAPEIATANPEVADLEHGPAIEASTSPQDPPVAAATLPRHYTGQLLTVALLLGAALAFRKIGGLRNELPDPWTYSSGGAARRSTIPSAEDAAFAAFAAAFLTGPEALSAKDQVAAPSPGGDNAISEFYARAPRLLATQRKLLEEIIGAKDPAARHRMLTDLRREMGALKGEAGRPEVLLVWQVASAVEGLLKQLTDKLGNVTASTLRTVAGGVELLADLCLPGLKTDLLTAQPLRFLAVDDDLISRKAISMALRKALTQPDLAEHGEAALALATRQTYDVIFLDVQMPGMDGFELCTRIHATDSNATTPVVFVTVQNDFDAHAKSTLSGGSELMGKPFLTFEVTVKALTLALRGRLRGHSLAVPAGVDAQGLTMLAPSRAKTGGEVAVPATPLEAATDRAQSSQWVGPGRRPAEPLVGIPASVAWELPIGGELTPEDSASQFLTRVAAQFAPVRDLFLTLLQTPEEGVRQEMLADIYLRIHALNPKTDSAPLHPAIQLSVALQGLLRKLLEEPKNTTPSTLATLAAGVDLLQDLCDPGLRSDLITNPPIRMLVVDDDPISRRAVACALQMAFEKPEAAESGEAALAAAAARPFDLIFMDVQMPGMDGFTACAKLHDTGLNRKTPVVFVTGRSDFEARTQMSRSGGSDLVSKPFLKSEITVKALTFALRGRIEKLAPVTV